MTRRKIGFDGWVLDRESGDLSRDGQKHRLQELPLKVLDLLLANPGALVTREELIAHLWPKGVVDFDTGLNTAVRKLRVALGDIAEAPRYIETIPRRGYRFLSTLDLEPPLTAAPVSTSPPLDASTADKPVDRIEKATPEPVTSGTMPASASAPAPASASGPVEHPAPAPSKPQSKNRARLILGAVCAMAVVLGIPYWFSHRRNPPPVVPSTPSALSLPDKSVAVLPFESLSGEPNNEFIALGIAETVLHRLGGMRDLTVIARTSSFVFRNRNEDARQIGRALNARYLVEGSVQKAGQRLRVQAQLVDANSGKQLWSLTFDRPLQDIFALQDEISSKLADQFTASLGSAGSGPSHANSPHLDAYLAYLQGRSLMSTLNIADVRNAVDNFKRATELDPTFAAAFAQQSRAISILDGLLEQHDPQVIKRAVELNDRALALNPQLGEAWVQRASLLFDTSEGKDVAGAENAYKKGLALEPSYGQGFQDYADFLWNQKRIDEAIPMIDRARQVDPLNPRNHYMKANMLYASGRDSNEVESLYLQALKLDPTYHSALIRMGQRYGLRGEFASALMMEERALAVEPESIWVRAITTGAYLSIGDVAAAEDLASGGKGTVSGLNVCVAMHKEDHATATRLAYEILEAPHTELLTMPQACAITEILRDALATRHEDRALRILEAGYAIQPGQVDEGPARSAYFWGVPMAKLLQAKGDKARADRLLHSILASTESEPADLTIRSFHFMARASAYCVLGERDLALGALENAVRQGVFPIWWIMDRSPVLEPLRQDPRYQALAVAMNVRLRKQAELVAKMRATRELPMRPANAGGDTT